MKRKNKAIVITAIILLSVASLFLLGLLGLYIYTRTNIDFESDIYLFNNSRTFESTTFYADGGLSDEYSPVEIELTGSIKKLHYTLDEISPYLKWGFLAVEDRFFYEHRGVDIKRTAAAAYNYFFGKEKRFGGSTITQQVVKNISGDNEPKLTRKLNEIIRAIHIEQNYSKDEILEVYLNVIPMSENMFGVGIASRGYFGCEPENLSIAEAATLIGITNAPGTYNPYNNPDRCIGKRNSILAIMHREGVINDKEYEEAVSTPLNLIQRGEGSDIYDSWFVETVIDDLTKDLAAKMNISLSAANHALMGGGYKVYTTMNIKAQKVLEKYFANKSHFSSEIDNGLGYAMVITDSKTGDLAAIVGGVGEKKANRILNRAIIPHTPGSVLKPIALYAPLIDEGSISWSSVFDDVPTDVTETSDGYRCYPGNSPAIYSGLITVSDALRLSKNTVAVRLCKMRGCKKVFESLKNDYGFDTLVENMVGKDGKSLTDIALSPMALGQLTYGVPLTKLTEAYSVFSGEGEHRNMRSYLAVYDHEGKCILKKEKKLKQIIKPTTAKIVTKMLEQVTDTGTAREITLDEQIPTAGKTGTSGGGKDKMFIGYTPYYTAGIWCGYDKADNSLEGVGTSHLKIWNDVMAEIHASISKEERVKDFSTKGLVYRPYCKDSGKLYSDNCLLDVRGSRLEYGYFTNETAPKTTCDTHIICYYDSVEKGIATEYCPYENLVKISLIKPWQRSFPCQIYITDAEYVYNDVQIDTPLPKSERLPYFYYALPADEYPGVSGEKRQFNCTCPMHN